MQVRENRLNFQKQKTKWVPKRLRKSVNDKKESTAEEETRLSQA